MVLKPPACFFFSKLLTFCFIISVVLPYITPFEMDENINFGDSVQLSCHVSKGDKPLEIRWSFHGKESLAQLGITTTKMGDRTSFLTIPSVVAAHNGNYTCIATNAAGSTSHTAAIHVNGIRQNLFLIFFIFS